MITLIEILFYVISFTFSAVNLPLATLIVNIVRIIVIRRMKQ